MDNVLFERKVNVKRNLVGIHDFPFLFVYWNESKTEIPTLMNFENGRGRRRVVEIKYVSIVGYSSVK